MTTHFTADLHIAHERILAMACRPFRDIGAHDRHMISQINKYVKRDDKLIVAGDLAWHGWPSYRQQIECKNVHIIWGNHDKAGYAKGATTANDVDFFRITPGTEVEMDVFVSHYPHAYWPKSHYGSYHVYGHVHADRERTLDLAFPGRRSMDVGVDNAYRLYGEYRPFSDMDLHKCLLGLPGHDPVSFYNALQDERLANFNGVYIEA